MKSQRRRDEGIGNFSFVGATGNSGMDYIICSQNKFKYFKQFNIEASTESLHFHISVYFETGYSFILTYDMDKEKRYSYKTRFKR